MKAKKQKKNVVETHIKKKIIGDNPIFHKPNKLFAFAMKRMYKKRILDAWKKNSCFCMMATTTTEK